MSTVAFEVQKAVDAVLLPVLDGLSPSVPLFDHVPDGHGYPFVQFSRAVVTPDNLLSSKVSRVQISLTVYSNFRGQQQVLEILGAIENALDDVNLALDDGSSVRCDLERADTVRDQDGVTYTGTAIYSVLVDHN